MHQLEIRSRKARELIRGLALGTVTNSFDDGVMNWSIARQHHSVDNRSVIVVLNGPLGIGKSTLAEALVERVDSCVMLDGDALVAVNPVAADPLEHLHSVIALLVGHHQRFGYRHFVINHIWRSPEELADLRRRFSPEAEFRAFLLTLPVEENLQRIARRASTRAIDERDFELRTVSEERDMLAAWPDGAIGAPFEVDATPAELVERLIDYLGLAPRPGTTGTTE